MPIFSYTALKEKGKPSSGMIDAESLEDAKQKLLKRQILVIKVLPIKKQERGHQLQKRQVLAFTRELAHLLKASLPLHEGLSALEERYRAHKMHGLLLDLCDQIRTGLPFSKALEAHPLSFDPLYRSMIVNAEQRGSFAQTLEELATLIEKQLHLQRTLLSTFLYPILLGSFCLVVLGVLLFFVIPSLFELFEGRSLHPFTRFVFACSRFALSAKWFLGLFFLGMGGGAVCLFFSQKWREFMGRIFMRLPFLQPLRIKIALVRFFRAAALLIEGGVPVLQAFQQTCDLLHHSALQSAMEQALKRLSQGESLESALQGYSFIPSLVPRMLGIAQQGGNLPLIMHQIAAIYEEDLEKSFARITSLAQPLLLLFLGMMVGFVLLSVLLPLTDISAFN